MLPPRLYIIIEMPSPAELAEEVAKHMEPITEETPSLSESRRLTALSDDKRKFVKVHAYIPHGSPICHPAAQSDPQKPFRFSQAMVWRQVDEVEIAEDFATVEPKAEASKSDVQ